MHKLLVTLNEQQRNAVQATEGPVLILAGAGSGKTKTLIHRIAYIIALGKAKPWNILAVTFTNKAAKEMKDRLRKLLGSQLEKMPIMGTFHSICVQILRREIHHINYEPTFVIYDANDSGSLIKKCIKDLGYDTKTTPPNTIGYLISKAKNELLTPSQFSNQTEGAMENIAAEVYELYQKQLQQNNALDFDDLLRLTVQIFQQFPDILKRYQEAFKYIFVDEYQDTNHAQYILVELLAKIHKNICVVGDDFQSIYSWRGANLQNILDFEQDYPKAQVILLEQNYRSTQYILEAANEIIKYNTQQKAKTLWTENGRGHKITIKAVENEQIEGEYILGEIFETNKGGNSGDVSSDNDDDPEYVSEDELYEQESILDKVMRSDSFQKFSGNKKLEETIQTQLRTIDLSNYVILYRTNAQSRALEETFIRYRVPYRLIGSIKFYERKEIRDVVAYLRCVLNPQDWVSLERISNVPARSLGANSWRKIEKLCREKDLTFLEITTDDIAALQMRPQQYDACLKFQAMMQRLHKAMETLSPSEIVELVVKKTGYAEQFNDKIREDQRRLENIEELKSVTKKFDHLTGSAGLQAFLEEITLVSDQDELQDELNAVTMMTVHAAKGLEFDTVFITGMEEGLFPHARSLFQPQEMEEERRLCYVALTRAKRKAYVLYALQRTVFGTTQISAPSRFINDIPEELVERV